MTLDKSARDLAEGKKLISDDELHKAINKAVYGQDEEPGFTGTTYKAFSVNPGGSRSANCAGDGGAAKANTAFATLICVCATDGSNSANAGKACSGSAALTNTWTANSNPSDDAMKDVKQLCNTNTQIKLTHAELARRISDVAHLVRKTSAASYIGTYLASSCSGVTGEGMCVKYTTITTQTGDPAEQISWLKNLKTLADRLHEHETAVTKLESIKEAVEAKRKLADNIAYMHIPQSGKQTAPTRAPEAAQPAVDDARRQQCKQHKDNKTAYENDKCKWEGKDCKYSRFLVSKKLPLIASALMGLYHFKYYSIIRIFLNHI
uniref:Variant surface glycoprotein 1125.5378 n=1 Tax=Trypanosoma brucei TaxID=5691 RepID=A0A1J0RC34_9TRYP|nr:variant surface glycoprotein 1125.5378 [Trypanosoma brucei]